MGRWERRKLRASDSQCGFSQRREIMVAKKGLAKKNLTWDFSDCNMDVSVDTNVRCRSLDVTFSHDTVTPLGVLFQILHF